LPKESTQKPNASRQSLKKTKLNLRGFHFPHFAKYEKVCENLVFLQNFKFIEKIEEKLNFFHPGRNNCA
jgi:hypothetical protein